MESLGNDVIPENLNENSLSNQKVTLIVKINQSKTSEVNMVRYMHLLSQYNDCHWWVHTSTETSLAINTDILQHGIFSQSWPPSHQPSHTVWLCGKSVTFFISDMIV